LKLTKDDTLYGNKESSDKEKTLRQMITELQNDALKFKTGNLEREQ
jgi:hypothetical protein